MRSVDADNQHATKKGRETRPFPYRRAAVYCGEEPPELLVDPVDGDDVEEDDALPRLRDERLERPVLVELPPDVVEDIDPLPVLPPLIEPPPTEPLPIEPVEPIDPLPIEPIDEEPDGIAPGVPDCAPAPAPMLPLDCDAPIAPLAPAEPEAPAAPDEPAPPPAPPPPACAMTATGVRATAAARIINFRMILSIYAVGNQPTGARLVPVSGHIRAKPRAPACRFRDASL